MGIEKRGNRNFLYHVRRENGRLVKKYVGSGDVADAAARRAEEERAGRAAVKEFERKLGQMEELSDLIFEACMYAAGYHRPKSGPWRKRRDHK